MSGQIKYWLITDTHFNDKRVCRDCNRPLNFEEIIYKNILKISSHHVLIHLGDICVGKDQEMHDKYIRQVSCRKWLISGNRDKKSYSWYLNNGWDFVADKIEITFLNKKILFSHRPENENGFDLNIHGHYHNAPLLLEKSDKQKCLVLEDLNYKPILLESFLKRLINSNA
jgi:calcineurin-like phosphoesterase family protein